MIGCARRGVKPFTDSRSSCCRTFAEQAVIAIENARLSRNENRQRQDELRVTFENMGDGVAMFDEELQLVAWNRKFQDMLDVPDEFLAERTDVTGLHPLPGRTRRIRRESTPEEQIRRCWRARRGQMRRLRAHPPERQRDRGAHNPVPGGGFVLIYADITERKRTRRKSAPRATRPKAALARREGGAGQPDPGREDGLAGPAHRRHRARDQEPAELRQQFRRAVGRAAR